MRIQLFALPLHKLTAILTIVATGSLISLSATAKDCPKDAVKAASAVSQPAHSAVDGKPVASGIKASAPGTIVEVAAANGSFKTLVAEVKAAGLTEVLSGDGPFTVFAPTDAAFAALPKGTVEALLKPENKAKLQQVLTYHVVSGSVLSKSIKPGAVKTVEGKPVILRTMGKRVMVNNATVTTADVKASNGVIHVIDKVLLPPGL